MAVIGLGAPPAFRRLRRRAPWPERRLLLRFEVVVLAAVGGLLGVLLAGSAPHPIGPVEARLSLRPALTGDTRIDVAPLGAISLDTHEGPVRLAIAVTRIRPDVVRRAVRDPSTLHGLGQRVAADLRAALVRLVVRALLTAAGGALLLTLLVTRRWRRALAATGTAVATLLAGIGVAAATWRPRALAEPHYSGLLTNAPAVVGGAGGLVARFDAYADELAGLVTDVTRLYDVTSALPAYRPDGSTIRLLHVSDLHLNPAAWGVVRSVVRQYRVDAVVDTGDLTDHGSRAEDRFAAPIGGLGVPYVFVRGNHDSLGTEAAVRRQRGSVVLDRGVTTVDGLRLFGVGDPRFTPDKTTRDDHLGDPALVRFGQGAADALAAASPVDVALTHDPLVARQLAGSAPVLLAGHTHRRSVERLPGSLLLVEGSTGGAGLRGVEGEQPTPLECSVLYFSATTHRLLAYDDITLGGLGLTSAQVQRHVVESALAPSGASRRLPLSPAGSR